MFNSSEREERQYLDEVIDKLQSSIRAIEQKILDYSESMVETKRFAWENSGADPVERAAYRIAVNEESIFAEMSLKERERLRKLALSPYFGRVDFAEEGGAGPLPYYVGIHAYVDTGTNRELVVDWRAPLSSIFYDYETGPATYRAPEGEISGDISLKRQYRIREGGMEYMLESALNIGDDILQQELSRTSDQKMKNIVATIQQEQNRIIRNDSAKVLIIQGAAGSGKTSIALHRVAFLLYRHKRTLRSDNVLILSPNKVFGSYIGNVLPELGEENIPQMGLEELAAQFLGKRRSFQTFAQQVEDLIERPDDAKIRRIRYKATNGFVDELLSFLDACEEGAFQPEALEAGLFRVTSEELREDYRRLGDMPVHKRLEKIIADRLTAYEWRFGQPLDAVGRRAVKNGITRMFRYRDALALYKDFLNSRGEEKLFASPAKGSLEYCDVFPLAYVTLWLEGTAHRYGEIEHLLVDEMQDYTPIQYAFLAKVFRCRMTILGDSHQNVNPYSSSSLETIRPYFPGSECIELKKSYRSTLEIVQFAQGIRRNPDIIPMERHGDEPVLNGCATEADELSLLVERIGAFRSSQYRTLGIICKSQGEADRLYHLLADNVEGVQLLGFASEEFHEGVIITSSHMSKGLEFDWVVVPGCNSLEYRSELDRSLLYIACTRAMHVLELTFHGEQSALIPPGTIWFQQGPGLSSRSSQTREQP